MIEEITETEVRRLGFSLLDNLYPRLLVLDSTTALMKSSMAVRAPLCRRGEWISLKTPGKRDELILAIEEGNAVARQVSNVMVTCNTETV